MVAAAKRINTAPKPGTKSQISLQDWQTETWEYYDGVPEVKHAANYVGDAMSKLRMFPAVTDPDDPTGPPIPVTDERAGLTDAQIVAAFAELARLKSPRGGQSEIQRQLAINLEVAGEGYIVGKAARTVTVKELDDTGRMVETSVDSPEEWETHSVSELQEKSGKYTVKPGRKSEAVELTAQDTVIRVWQRHPRWADEPDCALSGLLTECEALYALALLVIGDTNSKRNNGFLLVPNELTFSKPQRNAEGSEVEDDDEDPFLDALASTMQDPIADPASASAVQPTLVRGPAQYLEQFRHVLAARPADTIDEKIAGRVARLARGISLPVEVVMGHQATTFANATQVDQDTFDDYLEPRAELLVNAVTYGFYGPQCAENQTLASIADRLCVWYDPSGLITEPDPIARANEAHDRLLISDARAREIYGYTEEDAPDEAELERRGKTPAPAQPIAMAASPAPVDLLAFLAELVTRAQAPPPRALALTAASAERATNTYGAQLLAIDRDLRLKLTVAADAAMTRAMERAGNKLRSKAAKLVDASILRNVNTFDVARTLGPALVASADVDLLDGAWDTLETQFRAWSTTAHSEALNLASRAASGFSTGDRESLMLRQADSVDEAWGWMSGAMDNLASVHMFNPGAGLADVLGEFDPTLSVPPGLVRQSMSRAGGATGLVTDGNSAYVALYPDGTPPGMIATGEAVTTAMLDNGVQIEGYKWVYGPASRTHPFDPHLRLNGTQFVTFDDPVLSNNESFPSDAFFFPGDHAGCICDYEAALITPTGGATPEPPPELRELEQLEQYGRDAGIPQADMQAAYDSIPELRAAMRAEAKALQTMVAGELENAGVGMGQFPRPSHHKTSAGEWDWYRHVSKAERSNLSRWFVPSDTINPVGLDTVLHQAALGNPAKFGNMSTNEFGEWWLGRVNEYNQLGGVAQGKAYGVNLPVLDDLGLTPAHIPAFDRATAALNVAESWADQNAAMFAERANEAAHLLGLAATSGPAPWSMSFQSWADEVMELDYLATTGNTAASSRLAELIPSRLDLDGMSVEELYSLIVETARTAGEEVPGHARIPWTS